MQQLVSQCEDLIVEDEMLSRFEKVHMRYTPFLSEFINVI